MYLNFFNLREFPFRLTPDPKFLRLAEPHRLVLAEIIGGVVFRKGFVLVSGPVGTGKTTLLHAALQLLNRRLYPGGSLLSAFLVNPTMNRDEFLECLLHEFELNCQSTSKAARLAVLNQAFLARFRAGGTSVVFVDEAHLLSSEILEELRLLNNVDTYREKLLQIVLVGQPELLSVIERPELAALRQRIAARCKLRPLNLQECRTYIQERLNAAGISKNANLFGAAAVDEVYRISNGVPRLINLLCDRALAVACQHHSRQVTSEIVGLAADLLELSGRDDCGEVPAEPTHAVIGAKFAAETA